MPVFSFETLIMISQISLSTQDQYKLNAGLSANVKYCSALGFDTNINLRPCIKETLMLSSLLVCSTATARVGPGR